MGLFSKILESEPDDISALRSKIKAFEKGFEQRNDFDALQDAADCYFEISIRHPDEAKQTTAFMSGRNALERAIRDASVETIKPALVEKAIDVYTKKEKTMFLRSLYEGLSTGLKRFLTRLQNASYRQVTREHITIQPVVGVYLKLSQAAAADGEWFHTEFTALEKAKNAERHKPIQGSVKRQYDVPPP